MSARDSQILPKRALPVEILRTSDPLTPTVFHEPWWLEAATAGRYEEVTVKADGRTVGRLPFLREKHLGLTAGVAPELTLFLGAAVDEGAGSPVTRTLHRHEITRDLIDQLPPLHFFKQGLHRETPDALPFMQRGFPVLSFFTYEVAPAPEETIWRGLRDKTRNVIRRAREQAELVDLAPAEFLRLYENNLQRHGRVRNAMYGSNARNVLEAALARGRGRVLGGRDPSGKVSAAIVYVWDDALTYYLLTTRTPDSHNGLVSLLIWEAMRETAAQNRIFDFGGVGTPGSVLFYSAFGGEVRHRYFVERMSRTYRLARFAATTSTGVLDAVKAGPLATIRRTS